MRGDRECQSAGRRNLRLAERRVNARGAIDPVLCAALRVNVPDAHLARQRAPTNRSELRTLQIGRARASSDLRVGGASGGSIASFKHDAASFAAFAT